MNLVHIPRKDELLTGNEEYYELHTLQAGFSKYFLLTSFCRGDDDDDNKDGRIVLDFSCMVGI